MSYVNDGIYLGKPVNLDSREGGDDTALEGAVFQVANTPVVGLTFPGEPSDSIFNAFTDERPTPTTIDYDLGGGPISTTIDAIVVEVDVVFNLVGGGVLEVKGLFLIQTENGDIFLTLSGEQAVYDDGDPPILSQGIQAVSFQITGTDGINSREEVGDGVINLIACFAGGTVIACADGDVPVEDICPGDLVDTLDHGSQVVTWVGKQALTAQDLQQNPKLRPVCIMAGALGPGAPCRDLWVSPQHRVLIRSKIAERIFGETDILVPAIKLIDLPGIFVDEGIEAITYHHILFDRHQVVLSDGCYTESFFPGPQALKALPPDALAEVYALYPHLRGGTGFIPARTLPQRGKEVKALIARHRKNDRHVYSVAC